MSEADAMMATCHTTRMVADRCPKEAAGRVRLAARPDTAPEVLARLATDPVLHVRAAVAINQAAPASVDRQLSADADERVRALLAGKIAACIPGLSRVGQEGVRAQVLATLAALVEDEAVRVRAAIAEAIAEMPEAPRDLILRLARDTEFAVLDPVIRLSPLLSAADLLALIGCPPASATVLAVARRPGLCEKITDAIVATADSEAIQALLANRSAAIREAALDGLIARAAAHQEWHAPLVARPSLSGQAARALSEIVSAELLGQLAKRADLSPALAADLARRITAWRAGEEDAKPGVCAEIGNAEALAARGGLDEAALLEAVRRGQCGTAAARLAVAAHVPLAAVERAIALHSAKGLVALVWKAGFSMQVAGPIQGLFANLPPEGQLAAGPAGSFPLAIEEMRWQVNFLRSSPY